MKRCSSCQQILAQRITTCPACGSRQVSGMTAVDDYTIQAVIHEGRSSLVFRALKKGHTTPVTIRLFTDRSGVDKTVAQRLENELDALSRLPPDLFVQHYAIRKSREGFWYRISEWVDADNWGSIFVSGHLNDQRRMATLFYHIASALEQLHARDHFMPYLILDDILLPRKRTRHLSVKINYKLSRFLNARATHHGPMLKKLLQCHPDIVNQRAIDFRSGIWSLGKVFAELLTTDTNLTDFSSRIDRIKGLNPELAVLIKTMLSDDPDLRPQSMSKIVETLERILETITPEPVYQTAEKSKSGLVKQLTWFKRVVTLLVLILAVLLAAGIGVYMYHTPQDSQQRITHTMEFHTQSVGFLMVEYWLAIEDRIIYKNKLEGTAFLVDKEGYLLTNRHVACPWLEDRTLFELSNRLQGLEMHLNRRMYLWFEGARAFNRIQGFENSKDLEDVYHLTGAFSSHGKGKLRVAGVPRQPPRPGKRRNLPFQNDFAVLKIDGPPENIAPLTIATGASQLARLSPIIIIGFPLGSKTQDEYVRASITRGHVRRRSEALIQVDSSIYKGNSGGPALDARGRVVGIASGVITNQPMAHIPIQTPLSDFGLILPIQGPSAFIKRLKAGQPKWNGYLDFSLQNKLDRVIKLAETRDYSGAAALAHDLLGASRDPALLFTAALMDFCTGNLASSRTLFTQLISIEGENMASRLMLHFIDRLTGKSVSRDLTAPLFTLSWDHPDEFEGYLAKVLEDGQASARDCIEYETPYENAWCMFTHGLAMEIQKSYGPAIQAYKKVVFTAGANDHLFFMAAARLHRLLNKKSTFETPQKNDSTGKQDLWKKVAKKRKAAKKNYDQAVELIQRIESQDISHEETVNAFRSLLSLSPQNRIIMGRAAFYHARRGEWDNAVSFIDRYFTTSIRETALGLSLGLLKGQLLKLSGNTEAARRHFSHFMAGTRNAWYRILVKHLQATSDENKLITLAAGRPARLVILHTALGLEAEARKDNKNAVRHYREALGTYLDDWNEYELSYARLSALKSKDS